MRVRVEFPPGAVTATRAVSAPHRSSTFAERSGPSQQPSPPPNCHSGRGPDGAVDPAQFLTGATVGFEIPGLGVFWPPNLTSDPTGLGDWTDEEILAAIREGVRPDGRQLVPAMPSQLYSALTDEDGAALVAYLRTLPHAANRAPGPIGPDEAAPLPFYRVMLPAGAPKN